MKKLILILFLSFTSIVFVEAQTQTLTAEHKQTINPIIDDGFTRWNYEWNYDQYVGRSAKINSIRIDEDYGDVEVSGTFSYTRFGSTFQGTFIGKINNSGRLVTLSYIDAKGLRGSKTF